MKKEFLNKCLNHKLNIEIFDTLDSTNNYAKQLGSKGEKENTLIIAESQTGGRGRMGKSFFSPNGSGIYLSLLLYPDFPPQQALMLTVMAAASVTETIEKYTSKDVKIKWVNDIYIDGKKACGILTEGSIAPNNKLKFAVVGIGLNLTLPENGFPKDIEAIATSVFEDIETTDEIKCQIISEIINNFFDMYHGRILTYVEKYKKYSYLTGKNINIIDGEKIKKAKVLGITDNCHLLIENEQGEVEEISSGDVSVRTI